jgi:ferrochelatase
MRYSRPSIEDALEAMRADGVRRVVTLTLFPHYTRATTGSTESELARILARSPWKGGIFSITGVDRFSDDPRYLDAMAEVARRAYESFPARTRERIVILFSAHALPQKMIDRGDPYLEQIEATRAGILERLSVPNRHLLGFQSRTGPVRWTGPGVDELLRDLGKEGVREVLVIPLSFVSDHIETLYEIDLLFAEIARDAGIIDFRRPAALNDHPLFIEALAGLVERHLGAEGLGSRS